MAEDDLPDGEILPPNPVRIGPGRPKGSLNKTTIAHKDAMLEVYRLLQQSAGGDHAHFHAWAEQHPTLFYSMMLRLLPLQLRADVARRSITEVVFKGLND